MMSELDNLDVSKYLLWIVPGYENEITGIEEKVMALYMKLVIVITAHFVNILLNNIFWIKKFWGKVILIMLKSLMKKV